MSLKEENKKLRKALRDVLTRNISASKRAEGWYLVDAGCGCCGGRLRDDEIPENHEFILEILNENPA